MKTIYLVRHAKSSWKYPELDDFERPLNRRGHRDALFMGEILKDLKATPDLLISSPANRAAATARIIADAVNYPVEKIQYCETVYLSGKVVLTDIIAHISNAVKKAMLVGHNPGFTDLANYIGDRRISNLPTCGVFCVDLNISSWQEISEHCGKLKFFEFPRKGAS